MKRIEDMVGDVEDLELRRGSADTPVSAIHRDSRSVQQGGLFVALCGERVDGHDFIDDAVDRGASAVLVERGRSCEADVAVVEADELRSKLGLVASWFYDYPSRQLEVVAITGTNGKTSISYLLEAIFERAGHSPGIIGTVEDRWLGERRETRNTTPDGLGLQRRLRRMADDGVDVAVVEVSSHGLAHGRVSGTTFAAGVFTNLSRDHLKFHGSVEAYRRAKWSLFDHYLPAFAQTEGSRPVAVVNLDDDEGRDLYDHLAAREDLEVAGHGTEPKVADGADFAGRDVSVDLGGIELVVDERGGEAFEVAVELPGRFNAENTLGAVAVARMLGVESGAVVEALGGFDGIPGRMQLVDVEDGDGNAPAVFVDYAHTPDALQRALETLRPLVSGRLWVVFGCGGDRDRSKRAPMGRIAARFADQVVVTSDNPRSEEPDAIIDEIVQGLTDAESESDGTADWGRTTSRGDAIEEAVLRAGGRDVILIAGKGHETYQERDGQRRDFDDRRVARRALRRRGAQTCRD